METSLYPRVTVSEWAQSLTEIGVLAKKNLEGDEVLPKFCDICPNHNFPVLYG